MIGCMVKKRPGILILLTFLSFSVFARADYKLLVNGSSAFPQIIECIRNSNQTIYINMFIWRDDNIGNQIAEECVKAADRGVKVTISKDTYGSVCEHAEESGTSFFHKKVSWTEKTKINFLKNTYKNKIASDAKDFQSELYLRLINHPNITVQADSFKADHSKYYIFDDEILILGGINIEDKENGADMSGRIYNDYMLMLCGKEYVQSFKQGTTTGTGTIYFGKNLKAAKKKDNIFKMEELYLDMIDSSQKELTIVMAYFSPLKKFTDAILKACERGVKVKIVIPASANFQDDSNKQTVKHLLKKSRGQIRVYFSPKMLHTKLVAVDDLISFGSCNITKKAFKQLDELNVFVSAREEELFNQIMQTVNQTVEESLQITDYKSIDNNSFLAFLEGFVV